MRCRLPGATGSLDLCKLVPWAVVAPFFAFFLWVYLGHNDPPWIFDHIELRPAEVTREQIAAGVDGQLCKFGEWRYLVPAADTFQAWVPVDEHDREIGGPIISVATHHVNIPPVIGKVGGCRPLRYDSELTKGRWKFVADFHGYPLPLGSLWPIRGLPKMSASVVLKVN